MYGDAFDRVTHYHRWIALLGEHGYSLILWVSGWLSWWRRSLGLAGDWSLSDFIKRRMQSALRFIHEIEQAVARHASERGFSVTAQSAVPDALADSIIRVGDAPS